MLNESCMGTDKNNIILLFTFLIILMNLFTLNTFHFDSFTNLFDFHRFTSSVFDNVLLAFGK